MIPWRFLLAALCLVLVTAQPLGRAEAGGRSGLHRGTAKGAGKAARVKTTLRAKYRARPVLRQKHRLRPVQRPLRFSRSSNSTNKSGAKIVDKQEAKISGKRGAKIAKKQGQKANRKNAKSSTQQKSQRGKAKPAKRANKLKKLAKATSEKIARVKKVPAIRRMVRRWKEFSAATTRKFDRLQARAPPWLAKTMNALRTYNLLSLAAFNVTYLKNDAKFLGSFFAANAVVSYGVLPAAVTIGLDPVTSAVLNALSTPLTIAVLVLRDRHLNQKAGTPTTVAESARSILVAYKNFATSRRQKSSKRAHAILER